MPREGQKGISVLGVIRSHTESLTFEYTGQNNQLPFLSQTHPVFFVSPLVTS